MASTYNGTVSNERWENLYRTRPPENAVNVGQAERLLSALAAAAVVTVGLKRKGFRPFLLPVAAQLITRAVTGRCSVNRALGRNSARGRSSPVASVHSGEGIKVEKSVTVDRTVEEVYRFWRNFENLPRFMDHLESVTVLDENRSHWKARAPAGFMVEWDAVVHNEVEPELIAWRSLPGSEINHAGSVHFKPVEPAAGGAGRTEVRVVLSYEPPAGKLGAAVARLMGEEPSQQIEDDLRRFKQVVEADEMTVISPRPASRNS